MRGAKKTLSRYVLAAAIRDEAARLEADPACYAHDGGLLAADAEMIGEIQRLSEAVELGPHWVNVRAFRCELADAMQSPVWSVREAAGRVDGIVLTEAAR